MRPRPHQIHPVTKERLYGDHMINATPPKRRPETTAANWVVGIFFLIVLPLLFLLERHW